MSPAPENNSFGIGPRSCYRCGYNLTGQVETAICPECGSDQPARSLTLVGHAGVLSGWVFVASLCFVGLVFVSSIGRGSVDPIESFMATVAVLGCCLVTARYFWKRSQGESEASLLIFTPTHVHWVEDGKLRISHKLGLDAKITLTRHLFGGSVLRVSGRTANLDLWMPKPPQVEVANGLRELFANLPPVSRPRLEF